VTHTNIPPPETINSVGVYIFISGAKLDSLHFTTLYVIFKHVL